jgi:DNA repair photolyase
MGRGFEGSGCNMQCIYAYVKQCIARSQRKREKVATLNALPRARLCEFRANGIIMDRDAD